MKNRASTHILILLLIVALTAIAHYSIHYGALIRGYETSFLTAGRNLFLLFLLAITPIFLARFAKYKGNFLTAKETNPKFAGDISWNFNKFLVNRKGEVVARFSSKDKPDGEAVMQAIEKYLKEK